MHVIDCGCGLTVLIKSEQDDIRRGEGRGEV